MPYCFKEEGRLEQKWKRPLALLLSVAMMFSMSGTPVYAADMETGASAVCPHHVHDETCGYSEGTPCTHEHTDDCYTLVTQCVHEHTAECYSDGILPAEGEEKAADACTHVCSEESGCITKELNCPHVHDETCGYSEGSPCTFDPSDCELCGPTDSGEPEAPAECICETLCTEGSVNPDCPVCGAEGADLAACAGTVEEGDTAEETDPAQNPAEQTILSWEWIGADSLNEGVLALPGVSAENPVDLDAVVSMLPTGVTATVDGSADPVELALTWSCRDFPETASAGEYTFTAALPEGYALGDEAASLAVSVVLGGGTTLEITPSQPAGNGISGDPYRITNAAELLWFAQAVNIGSNSAWATLQNDIDLSGAAWAPITTYSGTFDGQGHTIDSLVLELTTDSTGDTYAGFVGELSGTIQNLTLGEGCRIAAVSTASFGQLYTGGICGENSGTIQNCINRGTVTVTAPAPFTGGICGYNNGGTIQNCANTGNINVTGTFMTRVGGILGYCNSSTIEGCFNTGVVSASASGWCYAGGICGESGTAITNCYWQEGTADKGIGSGTGDTESKPADDFASGAVCYLLNNSVSSDDNIWRQNLGEGGDPLPVPDSSHNIVYAQLNCMGGLFGVYGNSEFMEPPHSPENGICTVCKSYYEPAEKNSDGVYQIENAGNLFWFAALVNGTLTDGTAQNKSANAVLMNDITIPDGYIWTPIGNGSIVYTGTFDGQGHTISGMTIENAGSYSGLFGNSEGTIKSFTLTGSITVTTNDVRSVAGVAGYMKNTQNAGGTISDVVCGVDITVTATNTHHIGGIVGSLGQSSSGMAMVERCLYTGTLTASESVDCQGGIAGYAQTAAIRDCGNQGDVTGTGKESPLGGILGYCNSSDVSVTNCYNTGSVVKSDGTGQGAIIGMNNNDRAAVSNCYWLEGTADKGIGSGTDNTVSKPADDFASGAVCYLLNNSVSGDDNIWRQNLGEDGDDAPVPDSTHGIVYRNYIDCTHYGFGNQDTTPDPQNHSYSNGFCEHCGQYEPATLEGDTYQISNAGQLFWLAALVNGTLEGVEQKAAANAVLMNDITIPSDESGTYNWTPIGSENTPYTGIFDGQGHTIDHLTINSTADYQGLVGSLGEGGVIQNLTMGKNCSVTGGNYVGGICGYSENGTIANCTNSGAVTGSDYVGGICGANNGTLQNCYNTGAVTGGDAGGICGTNNGTITNCYWLEGTAAAGIGSGSGEATSKNETEFASGEVCFLLNGSTSQGDLAWFQTLGEGGDTLPVLDSTRGVVYAQYFCDGKTLTGYYANNNDFPETIHNFDKDGFCTFGDHYQPAEQDGEGVYQITNAGQLFWFAALVNGDTTYAEFDAQDTAAKAVLMKDITIPEGRNWTPIGNYSTSDSLKYTGAFDGDGHTIQGMVLNNPNSDYQGLVGYLAEDGTIKDLTMGETCSVTGNKYVGGICGESNRGTIQNCTNNGTVTGGYAGGSGTGGVCGYSYYGSIDTCTNNGAVTGSGDDVGGICGYSSYGFIYVCTNSGTVTGSGDAVGGITGYSIFCPLTGCTNSGTVTGNDRVGGVCGYNYDQTLSDYPISGCTNSGTVTGNNYVGGVCGYNSGTFTECINNGDVTSSGDNVGGVCGYNSGTFTECTNSGTVTGNNYVGGVCGYNESGTLSSCTHNGNVTGNSDYVGGVCGYNSGTLENSTNEGNVKGYSDNVGGICGYSQGGTVQNCTNNGTAEISGSFVYYVGGICGQNNGGAIANCANSGAVTSSSSYAGGICGRNYQGTITGCTNNGAVTAGGSYVGGICGQNYSGTIETSYNRGDVDGGGSAGGVCGENSGGIQDCYNAGGIASGSSVGGVCGRNLGNIQSCYNAGGITGGGFVGSVCGNNNHTITNCYWLDSTCTIGVGDGGGSATVKTAPQFASGEVTWLLNGSTSEGTLVWFQNLGEGGDDFPLLDNTHGVVYSLDGGYANEDHEHSYDEKGFCRFCGAYQPADLKDGVYQITTAGNLFWFAARVNGDGNIQNAAANAALTADIDLSGLNMGAIGTEATPYTGTFDGAGHTIYGLRLQGAGDSWGFVRCLGEGGKIQNLTMGENCSVTANGSYVGVLCGQNNGGTITGCTNRGTARGNSCTGGLCGRNEGTMENCNNYGAISSGSYAGGICGRNEGAGIVDNCNNYGAVSGDAGREWAGGICGSSSGILQNSTNFGDIAGNYGVGGICGNNNTGTLSGCANTGTVTAGSEGYAGGVCGINSSEAFLANCYSTGTVTGVSPVGGLCAQNRSTLSNCYWLDTACGEGIAVEYGISTKAESKTADEFASGEVAYLLNGSTSTGTLTWFQNLDNGQTKDSFPLLDSTHGTVYPIGDLHCDGTAKGDIAGYSNDPGATGTRDDHNFGDEGFCTVCGQYQPAILNGGVYEISNAGQLFWFGAMVNGDSSKADFEEQDLSAGAVLTEDITIPEGHNWTAMGNYYRPYTGTFDGAGHTIQGLKLESNFNYQGLVGCLDKDGRIQNLTMGASCSVSGSFYVGVLCGYNAGTIQNCTNNGTATATVTYSGGICGVNFGGAVKGCTNTGKVSGRNDTGGICGNNSSTVENCHNTGAVTGSGAYTGGVCGYSNGTVKGCTNSGKVSGSGNYVGGVCGNNIGANATLSGCTNSGAVTGSGNYVGGLSGCNETGYLINCYTTGGVSGGSDVGGVCGNNNIGTVANCYTTGAVSGSSNVGGVCGVNGGALRNCYWLDTAYQGGGIGSGTATDVAAKSADEFASGEVAYLLNDSTRTGTHTWFQNLDNGKAEDGFPLLDSTHGTVYPIGDTHCDGTFKEGKDAGYTNDPDKAGTQDDHAFDGDGFCTACHRYQPAILNGGVYGISNAGQLFWFAALVNGDTSQEGITATTANASAVLTTDITIPAGHNWTSIGSYSIPYTGTFDGAGYTIEGLNLDGPDKYQGFVGRLGQGGKLQNLTLGASCLLSGTFVGGICGYNEGTITGCINRATVNEYGSEAGGICSFNNGIIENCANTGGVRSYYEGSLTSYLGVGGICGYNYNLGIIRNCYNTGLSAGQYHRGGICGYNSGTIQNCYWSIATGYGIGSGSGEATLKSDKAFASGEVAWLLNGSTSTGTLAWYQNLDNGQTPDASPVLNSSHGTVYEIDSSLKFYSNDPNAVPPVTEVTITWGSLSYTYSESTWNAATHSYEGGGWTTDTENGNTVKVENTGNTAVSVSYAYTAVESGITGSFTDGENPVSPPVSLPENGSSTVYLILAGKPEKELEKAIIGSVTVTIGGENE